MNTNIGFKKIWLTIYACTICFVIQAQVYNGDLTLYAQKDVNAFNYTEVTGYLKISGNNINDLSPLSSLTSVGNRLYISNNPILSNLTGLENVSSVSGLWIDYNPELISLEGLQNINSLGFLNVRYNDKLISLTGLNIITLGTNTYIMANPSLANLNGLHNVTSVSGRLVISGNPALTNLIELQNISSFGRSLRIDSNNGLTSLDGLQNVTFVREDVLIRDNINLTSFCALYDLINGGGIGGGANYTFYASANAINPTEQEIIDGGACPLNTPPVAVCQNVTVSADENCLAIVTASEVNNGSMDPDGDEISLSIFPEGPYDLGMTDVTLTVDDGMGGTSTCEAVVTVINELPVITSVVANSSDPMQLGTPTTLTVNFQDDNADNVNIKWGDSLEDNYIATMGEVIATHAYSLPGVYTATVTVTDPCTEQAMYDYKYIVIYNSEDGFVTGGGWFFSPECAFKASFGVSGKATFGFVAKYKKGSTIPDGNTQFQFNAGDINFRSSKYDDMRLVIAHFKANYTGTGTNNGEGYFGFLVSAIDGKIKGDAIDKFRIKIWDKNRGGQVIYDNNCVDNDDNSDPAIAIDGGSIIIHNAKLKSAENIGENLSDIHTSNMKIYPNPFADIITFEFVTPEKVHVNIDIYDVTGRKVQNLFNNFTEDGVTYNVEFIPKAENSSVYIYHMTIGENTYQGKIINKKD